MTLYLVFKCYDFGRDGESTHIFGVFTDKGKAENMAKSNNNATVEEIESDTRIDIHTSNYS